MRRYPTLLILLLLVPSVEGTGGGGAVRNAAPTLEGFNHTAGPTPPANAVDEFSGMILDRNGEADILAIEFHITHTDTASFTRTLNPADLENHTEPQNFTQGWKIWNPSADDGLISFRFNHTYTNLGLHVVRVVLADDQGSVNATQFSLFVGAVLATPTPADTGAGAMLLRANLGDSTPGTPLGVAFPDLSPDSDAGLQLFAATFDAANDPKEPITFQATLYATPPAQPAAPAGTRAALHLDLRLTRSSDPNQSVAPTSVTLQFALRQSWIAAECPPPDCTVKLFHFRDTPSPGAWELLNAFLIGDPNRDPALYESTLTSLSPFILGGHQPPPPPQPAGGGGGGPIEFAQSATPSPNATINLSPNLPSPTLSSLTPNETIRPKSGNEAGNQGIGVGTALGFLAFLAILSVGLSSRGRQTLLLQARNTRRLAQRGREWWRQRRSRDAAAKSTREGTSKLPGPAADRTRLRVTPPVDLNPRAARRRRWQKRVKYRAYRASEQPPASDRAAEPDPPGAPPSTPDTESKKSPADSPSDPAEPAREPSEGAETGPDPTTEPPQDGKPTGQDL